MEKLNHLDSLRKEIERRLKKIITIENNNANDNGDNEEVK
jgi:hypothetical protein